MIEFITKWIVYFGLLTRIRSTLVGHQEISGSEKLAKHPHDHYPKLSAIYFGEIQTVPTSMCKFKNQTTTCHFNFYSTQIKSWGNCKFINHCRNRLQSLNLLIQTHKTNNLNIFAFQTNQCFKSFTHILHLLTNKTQPALQKEDDISHFEINTQVHHLLDVWSLQSHGGFPPFWSIPNHLIA